MRIEKQVNLSPALFVPFCLLLSFLLFSAMLTGCGEEHFTLSIFAQGEEDFGISAKEKKVNSVFLNRLDYDFDEGSRKITDVSGIVTLNASIESNAAIASVRYLSSQPGVLLYFPDRSDPSDMRSIIQKGKQKLNLENGKDSSYVRLGLIIETNASKEVEEDSDLESAAALALIESLNEDFLEVDVTFKKGATANKKYSLFAANTESGSISYRLKEDS